MENFKTGNYFDFSQFKFSDIFEGIEFVWEVLPKMSEYINSQFQNGKILGNYGGMKNVFLDEGTVISEGAKIIGPSIIGKNCIIGHGSLLRGSCLLGDNVHIGHGVEIKNSIVLNGSTIAHLNYVGDSIIGSGVNIAAGAIIANFRLDKRSILVNKMIDSGLKKFGAIVGDGSSVGANAVLNPGTILGRRNVVYPLVSVKGVHKNGEIIK